MEVQARDLGTDLKSANTPMGNINVKGRRVKVCRSAEQIYILFSDLNNISANLPADISSKADITTTRDTLTAKVQGFDLGLRIEEKNPYSLIKMVQNGNTLFSYTFLVKIESLGEIESEFGLEMDTELPGMFKSIIGSKLQDMIDKLTDAIEKSLSEKG